MTGNLTKLQHAGLEEIVSAFCQGCRKMGRSADTVRGKQRARWSRQSTEAGNQLDNLIWFKEGQLYI